jgi:hypothetical protein
LQNAEGVLPIPLRICGVDPEAVQYALVSLIAAVSDNSNLTIDPEIDSYFLFITRDAFLNFVTFRMNFHTDHWLKRRS